MCVFNVIIMKTIIPDCSFYRSEFRRNSYSSDSISRKHRKIRIKPNTSSENRVVQVIKILLTLVRVIKCIVYIVRFIVGVRNAYKNVWVWK